jgi:uncharacterized protein
VLANIAYLDSSAFVKLVTGEPGAVGLRQGLERWPWRVSAALLRTEVVRALRRSGHDDYIVGARALMRSVHLVQLDQALLDRAADLMPSGLRSLDAIHLAAAASLGEEVGIMYVYDVRLKNAAEAMGLSVESPA